MDSYTPISAVGSLVAGIVFLTIFFSFWDIFRKRIAGDNLDVGKDLQISELKETRVNVHLKSGSQLRNVTLLGYCSTHREAPYEFKQLLIMRDEAGKKFYVRISEIEYL